MTILTPSGQDWKLKALDISESTYRILDLSNSPTCPEKHPKPVLSGLEEHLNQTEQENMKIRSHVSHFNTAQILQMKSSTPEAELQWTSQESFNNTAALPQGPKHS